MPTYDYECTSCGHSFQVVERISEHEHIIHKCPKCESTELERVFTNVFVKTEKKS